MRRSSKRTTPTELVSELEEWIFDRVDGDTMQAVATLLVCACQISAMAGRDPRLVLLEFTEGGSELLDMMKRRADARPKVGRA